MAYEFSFGMLAILGVLTATVSAASTQDRIKTFYNKLYSALPREGPNTIVSPFNVHLVLSLLYQGAAGDTADTLKQQLHVPDKFVNAENYKHVLAELDTVDNITLTLANKLYIKQRYKLTESYMKVAQHYFMADVENVDFTKRKRAAQDMNKWLGGKTSGKFEKIISPSDLDDNTRAVILNALVLKADWLKPFNADESSSGQFYTTDTDTVPVTMMKVHNYFWCGEYPALDAKILKLPLADNRFNMVIVLPNARTGIHQLERKIVLEDMSSVLDEKNMQKKKIKVLLPKFKFNYSIELRETLTQIGFGKIFSYFAIFNNMITMEDNLRFDKVIQKSYIDVTEKGLSVAMGSATQIRRSGRKPHGKFDVNHPFLFYITVDYKSDNVPKNRNYNILFMGKVTNPWWSEHGDYEV